MRHELGLRRAERVASARKECTWIVDSLGVDCGARRASERVLAGKEGWGSARAGMVFASRGHAGQAWWCAGPRTPVLHAPEWGVPGAAFGAGTCLTGRGGLQAEPGAYSTGGERLLVDRNLMRWCFRSPSGRSSHHGNCSSHASCSSGLRPIVTTAPHVVRQMVDFVSN